MNVIKYHGLPITPATAAVAAISGAHAFVSFAHPEQLGLAMECAESFAGDNGAWSAHAAGEAIVDWAPYYRWVESIRSHPAFDFTIIPDVIDGTEEENRMLLSKWPHGIAGVPVWHLHESFEWLSELVANWPRIALGSSAQFSTIGSDAWWTRMDEAMRVICDENGAPKTKLHGLRMLNPSIFTEFPFASADSTNIARNIGIDLKWRGTYLPAGKDARARVLRERIESQQSPGTYKFLPLVHQNELSLFA